jgi:hypothetical protein
MFFPPPRRSYSEENTSMLDVLDDTGNAIGFINFATEFKYLGSIVHQRANAKVHLATSLRGV